jgi:PhzF family phenazine biosynthesis protein
MPELVAGLIDVFADTPLSGNPLAIVEGAEVLNEDEMRRIAGEFNQAETTFILPSDRADWRLRSFTANGSEVFGPGHNALGAWLWLAEQGALGEWEGARRFLQEMGSGVLPVQLERIDGRFHGRLKQPPMRLLPPPADMRVVASALGLDIADIVCSPAARPASTGAVHLLVRLRDRAVVDQALPQHERLAALLAEAGAEGCYIYAMDEPPIDKAYARAFSPTIGLWEDSATGTAACPLAAYLGQEDLLRSNALVVEQGVKMGRRSVLKITLEPDPVLSGSGVIALLGVLRI